jgi:hypothetical protein
MGVGLFQHICTLFFFFSVLSFLFHFTKWSDITAGLTCLHTILSQNRSI